MGDDKVVDIEAFVVGVGFGILEKRKKELSGLLGPTALSSGRVPSLGLGVTAGTTDVTPERQISVRMRVVTPRTSLTFPDFFERLILI